jgi:hypothetical protein
MARASVDGQTFVVRDQPRTHFLARASKFFSHIGRQLLVFQHPRQRRREARHFICARGAAPVVTARHGGRQVVRLGCDHRNVSTGTACRVQIGRSSLRKQRIFHDALVLARHRFDNFNIRNPRRASHFFVAPAPAWFYAQIADKSAPGRAASSDRRLGPQGHPQNLWINQPLALLYEREVQRTSRKLRLA